MRASHLVWKAAGCPAPFETDGAPIPAKGNGSPCAACGEPGSYRMAEAISDNFTTVKNRSRAWPMGGDMICAACIFACKALALRCALWFAREDGIWWVGTRPIPGLPWTRPDALSALLCPPEPPFVAAYPRTGIDHGGETHLDRCWWPKAPPPARPLTRLQSKHVAIYARVATSRARYPLQVDDQHDVVVDVAHWAAMRVACDELLAEMRAGCVGAMDAKAALVTLRPPPRCPLPLLARWSIRTRALASTHQAPWWPMFVELLWMPPLPEKEMTHAPTVHRADAKRPSKDDQAVPNDARVPAAGDAPQDAPPSRAPAQLRLF